MENEKKSSADLIVEELKESKSQVAELTAKTTQELKSIGDSITLGLKEAFEGKSKEEIKSLEDKLANKEAEIKSLRSGHGISKIKGELEEKSLISIASKLHNGEKVNISSEEYKSIARFSDTTSVGYGNRNIFMNEEIDVNKQPIVTILSDIDILPPVQDKEKTVSWKGYDESLVDILEANETDPATLSQLVQNSLIELQQRKVKAAMAFSDDVIIASMNGVQLQVLNRNFNSLERKYDRNLQANVYQDVIKNALAGAIGTTRFASTTNDAPADAQAREDLRLFPSKLKIQYENSAVLYVSRAFLNSIFSKEASDGHLTTEQFRTNDNGITFFVTGSGKAMPVRQFEHSQIGTYKSLADGTTDITADYVNGGENTGKLLAFVGDLKSSYKMVPSSLGYMDVDRSAKSILSDGFCLGGKVSYAAQGVVVKEGIKVFYAK